MIQFGGGHFRPNKGYSAATPIVVTGNLSTWSNVDWQVHSCVIVNTEMRTCFLLIFFPVLAPPVPPNLMPPATSSKSSTHVDEGGDKGGADGDRSALLASIRNFKAGQLKQVVTVDKSAPRV